MCPDASAAAELTAGFTYDFICVYCFFRVIKEPKGFRGKEETLVQWSVNHITASLTPETPHTGTLMMSEPALMLK